MARCVMSDEAIDGIRVGLQLNRQVDVVDRNVIWQEIVAALNRRDCVSNWKAGKLVDEGWSAAARPVTPEEEVEFSD